jgi:DNA-binding beta-propeller fold protein YncE
LIALLCLVALLSSPATFAQAAPCKGPAAATSVDMPAAPFGVASSADACWLFVSLAYGTGHGGIAVLHNENGTFKLTRVQALDAAAFGESLSHDGQLLAVATEAGVSVLDTARLEAGDGSALLGTLKDGSDAGYIETAVTADGHLLFVSEENNRRLGVFDLAKAREHGFKDDAPIGHIPTGLAPVGLAFAPDEKALYSVSEVTPLTLKLPASCAPEGPQQKQHPPGLLIRIDTAMAATDPAKAAVAFASAGCNPVRVAVSPDGSDVWVTARGEDALLRLSTADMQPGHADRHWSRYAAGASPVGLAIRDDGRQVWVTDSNRFQKAGEQAGLTGLDIDGGAAAKRFSLPLDGFPRELIFLPGSQTLVTTLYAGKKVAFVPTGK